MGTRYEFDFSKTTLTELKRCSVAPIEDVFELYDRVVVGGIRHLSPNEVCYVVAAQFKAAFERWMAQGRVGDIMTPKPAPQVFDTSGNDDTLRDMLDGIEGL